MSRSNPTLENPSQRWYEWDATEGTIYYYDKEKKKEVDVGLPFSFMPLDILSTVTGWHERSESNIYASEVKRVDLQPIRVKAFGGGLIAEGMYSNIKDTIKAAGGKFTKSIYLAYKDENDEMKTGNLQIKGAALQAWIDFSREVGRQAIEAGAVVISGAHQEQNGSITYMVPEFLLSDVSQEGHRRAMELDKELQQYLENKTDHVDIPETPEPEQQADIDMSEYRNGGETGEQLYGPPKGGEDMLADVDDDLPF